LWTFYTVVLLLGGLYFLQQAVAPPRPDPLGLSAPNDVGSDVAGWLVMWAIAALTGTYAYRIWTWRARRLWLLIIV
jgi:hypothetical protein